MQQQHTEKPYKVLAEQYDAALPVLQTHVCVCTVNPWQWTDGRPHVHTTRGMVALATGDWIIEALWSPHGVDVISNAEFLDRF